MESVPVTDVPRTPGLTEFPNIVPMVEVETEATVFAPVA